MSMICNKESLDLEEQNMRKQPLPEKVSFENPGAG